MKQTSLLFILLATAALFCIRARAEVQATFMAAEALSTYYHNGFDGEDNFNRWTWDATGTGRNTWYMSKAGYISLSSGAADNFLNYNPNSTHSLAIAYSKTTYLNETGTSEDIEVKPNTTLSFWLCPGVFVAGTYDLTANYDWTVCVVDKASGDSITAVQGTEQYKTDSIYGFYHWRRVNCDLSAYAGKTVNIRVHYWGKNGDSMLLDDFEMVQMGADEARPTIAQGEAVHFTNYSQGENLTYHWEFPGGIPETSTDENPIVTYMNEGEYDVTLTVTDGTDSDTQQREKYVNVEVIEPVARVAYADNGYYRIGGGCHVPNNTWISFRDRSLNFPTAWNWTFNGANTSTSEKEKTSVYFPTIGYYNFSLTAQNKAGSDTYTSDARAIKVGGSAGYVWNLNDEQGSNVQTVQIQGQGYFAGSNTRRIYRFAEKFEKPLSPALISKVGVLFTETTTYKPDTTIVVGLYKVGEDGFPGDMLAYGTKKLSACKAVTDLTNVTDASLTEFNLNKQVSVDEPFFVVIAGIPAYEMNPTTHAINRVTIACSPIGNEAHDGKNTSYVFMDSIKIVNNMAYFINKFHWEENMSSPLSIALCPYLKFTTVDQVGINDVKIDNQQGVEARFNEEYYDLSGRRLAGKPEQGFYIERNANGTATKRIAR